MKKLRLCKVKLGVLKKSAKGTQRLSNYTIYLVGEHFGKKPFKVKQGKVSGKGQLQFCDRRASVNDLLLGASKMGSLKILEIRITKVQAVVDE